MTQLDRILEYFKAYRTLTSLEAVTKLGCTRLAARVLELERRGYIFSRKWVKVKNRFGYNVRVIEYRYIGKLEIVA